VLRQHIPGAHHQVEGALAAPIHPIGIMQLAGAVHAQSDEEIVLLEELAPRIVEQQSVGLEGVLHALPGPEVLLHQGDGMPEELQLH